MSPAAGAARPKGTGKGTGTAGVSSRSTPLAAARAISQADVAALMEVGPVRPEHRGDQLILDGDDRHLDDDRLVEPQDDGPFQVDVAAEGGQRSRPLIELLHVEGGSPTYRVIDLSTARSRSGSGRTVAEAHDHHLDLLGQLLVEHEAEAIAAADERQGRARLARFTESELAALAEVRHAERAAGGVAVPTSAFDHSFVSRISTERIRFPWGEVEVQELARVNKGDITDDDLVLGWRTVVALLSAGKRHADVKRALAVLWRRGDDAGKYATDLKRIYEDWDRISGIASTAKDGNQLRVALEQRGISLHKRWLYHALASDLLDHPDDLEA